MATLTSPPSYQRATYNDSSLSFQNPMHTRPDNQPRNNAGENIEPEVYETLLDVSLQFVIIVYKFVSFIAVGFQDSLSRAPKHSNHTSSLCYLQ